ncbi:MAG: type III secretion system chaperone [Candidatus Thorarchaeota archaeon]|nr:type III secretion system chaperone [Candidatus Thorarchaeota archaeon]
MSDTRTGKSMSTTWYITKEYLKRLEINFEEKGRKTFNLLPYGPPQTEEIEIFPGSNWITLTTRLMDITPLSAKDKRVACMHLLKANAKLVEITFGVDKKNCIILRNAIPVTGISYDAFNCTYDAHISGIKFFHEKMKPMIAKE